MTLSQLRAEQYEYNGRLYPYINDWRRNPYTWLKARFYMEASAVLVYFLAKTPVAPNAVTIAFAISGLLAGVLLAVPSSPTVLAAAVIFFARGVLDWTDGHLARVTGRTSFEGAILDPYSSLVGSLSLQTALGFYCANRSGMHIFYYLSALIPLLSALKLNSFAGNFMFRERLKPAGEMVSRPAALAPFAGGADSNVSFFRFFQGLLDDRARTVDLVCLLLAVELYFGIFLTWVFFAGFLARSAAEFTVSFYRVAFAGQAERDLAVTMDILRGRGEE